MKTITAIGKVALVFLCIASIIVDAFFIYLKFFCSDVTLGVNYINDQLGLDVVYAEELSQEEKDKYEERWFLEANYYSNDSKNGSILEELKFNFFTDWSLTSDKYRSAGMQLLDSPLEKFYEASIDTVHYDETVYNHVVANYEDYKDLYNSTFGQEFGQAYFYTTFDDVSFDGSTNISTHLIPGEKLVIKIDGKPYLISLDKNYSYNFLQQRWLFPDEWISYDGSYTYYNIFADIMQAIKTNSKGYGDYYITVDLSKYFSIWEFDGEKFKQGEMENVDIIKTYSVVKFHYDKNGVKSASQSLFDSINLNSNWGETSEDVEYWQEKAIYTLNEEDFEYRYSEVYNGSLISISNDTKKLFDEMPYTDIVIKVDLDSTYLEKNNITITGIDYNGFENLKINTLEIKGFGNFNLLDYSLNKTNLKTLKVSEDINLLWGSNVINTDFTEVVL